MTKGILRHKYRSKPNNKRKNIAVRVHVFLYTTLTRIGTIPPMPRPIFHPRDWMEPFSSQCSGRAMARGRARLVSVIKTGTSTCAYSNSLCGSIEKRQKSDHG